MLIEDFFNNKIPEVKYILKNLKKNPITVLDLGVSYADERVVYHNVLVNDSSENHAKFDVEEHLESDFFNTYAEAEEERKRRIVKEYRL